MSERKKKRGREGREYKTFPPKTFEGGKWGCAGGSLRCLLHPQMFPGAAPPTCLLPPERPQRDKILSPCGHPRRWRDGFIFQRAEASPIKGLHFPQGRLLSKSICYSLFLCPKPYAVWGLIPHKIFAGTLSSSLLEERRTPFLGRPSLEGYLVYSL